ncbi:TRAP transporter small permease [Oscillibacter sp.]|uniref:TRAP transporter small permease n=1 Tax=Oscillibacter sp. TaxID=1945593 RepID=UPI0028A19868|nr:TRAP transporter small permease [Oscillibacter sp.]
MSVLRFLNTKLEEVFLVILMSAATILVFAQVFTRYILRIPLPWSEEIARYMFLWLTWVGASFATKERKHVNIDVVYQLLPQAGKKVCTVLSTFIWIVFVCIMAYLSLKLTLSVASGGQIAIGSGVPMWIPYASIPTGMTLMLFRLLQNCVHDFKAGTQASMEGGENA